MYVFVCMVVYNLEYFMKYNQNDLKEQHDRDTLVMMKYYFLAI